MAKGLRTNIPANGRTNVTADSLRKDMNRQASSQKLMAHGASLNLATEGSRNSRPYRMVSINGVTVKRYI